MNGSGLFDQINYKKAYRKNRLGGALWVLEHPETFEELLKYCFEDKTELSHKAAWVLEFVCLENLSLLYPYLDYFFYGLGSVKKDQSLRPMAHICELLAIRYFKKRDSELKKLLDGSHKQIMTECAFDWLITDQKVACQIRAMTSLFYLGTEFNWIHPELVEIIQEGMHEGSAGYKAHGRKTLEQIRKFREN